MTDALTQLAQPAANVSAFIDATTPAALAAAVAATRITGPTLPDNISGNPEIGTLPPPPPGAVPAPRGGTGSWIDNNTGLFVFLVAVIPVLIIATCGTGYYVYRRRQRRAAEFGRMHVTGGEGGPPVQPLAVASTPAGSRRMQSDDGGGGAGGGGGGATAAARGTSTTSSAGAPPSHSGPLPAAAPMVTSYNGGWWVVEHGLCIATGPSETARTWALDANRRPRSSKSPNPPFLHLLLPIPTVLYEGESRDVAGSASLAAAVLATRGGGGGGAPGVSPHGSVPTSLPAAAAPGDVVHNYTNVMYGEQPSLAAALNDGLNVPPPAAAMAALAGGAAGSIHRSGGAGQPQGADDVLNEFGWAADGRGSRGSGGANPVAARAAAGMRPVSAAALGAAAAAATAAAHQQHRHRQAAQLGPEVEPFAGRAPSSQGSNADPELRRPETEYASAKFHTGKLSFTSRQHTGEVPPLSGAGPRSRASGLGAFAGAAGASAAAVAEAGGALAAPQAALPGPGGGGYLGQSTASGRLPAFSLDRSYSLARLSPTAAATAEAAAMESGSAGGALAEPSLSSPYDYGEPIYSTAAAATASDARGGGHDESGPSSGRNLNPLFEPVTMFANPLHGAGASGATVTPTASRRHTTDAAPATPPSVTSTAVAATASPRRPGDLSMGGGGLHGAVTPPQQPQGAPKPWPPPPPRRGTGGGAAEV